MNKKKLLTLAMALSMVAILVVGGTIAYFTDTDEAENVFTFGNVDIIQRESQRNTDEEVAEFEDEAPLFDETYLEQFEDDKVVFPAVLGKLEKPERDDISVGGYDFTIRRLEGNYVDKIVSVYNKGSQDAFIRTIIAIPNMNGYDDNLDATENPLHWNAIDANDVDGFGWDWNGSNDDVLWPQLDKVKAVEIEGKQYDLYVATHNEAVPAETWTSPSMVGFYLDDSVDFDNETKSYFSIQEGKRIELADWIEYDEETGLATLKILVASQACQTAGFADAWEALDEAFGDITSTNHPWYVEDAGEL